MSRNVPIKILRTTRAALETQKAANNLLAGEPYLITDENRIAVGTAVNSYQDFKKTSEASGMTKTILTSQSLSSASWSLVSGLYEYTFSNADITTTSVVDCVPTNTDIAVVIAAQIYPNVTYSTGSCKFYAKNAPTGNIACSIIIWN